MKVTTTWLRNCLGRTILEQVSDAEIVAALEKSGLEIEQISYSKPIDPLVISCSVKKVVQHPAADRLKIAEMSTGKNTLVVVCGAPNVRAGMKAALA
jgi:phenylalanyl-tRNA synthetase beta chain